MPKLHVFVGQKVQGGAQVVVGGLIARVMGSPATKSICKANISLCFFCWSRKKYSSTTPRGPQCHQ